MSDVENVSAEVRELMELVLKEPVQTEENVTANEDALPNQSMDVQSEIPVIARVDVPVVTENPHSHITIAPPEPDLRAIESNALKLIAQYGSDSDSDSIVSDDTASSDEVVVIDDVQTVLQKTIADGNYRVVSSDSDERCVSKMIFLTTAVLTTF